MIPFQPQFGRPCLCFKLVPGFLFIVQSEGWTTVNVMVALQPEPVAVIVTLPAASPAVKVDGFPELGLRVPVPLVIAQVAVPSE
jgi:hypothetical protein